MLDAQAAFGREAAAYQSVGRVTFGRRLTRVVPEDNFDRGPLVGGGGSLLLSADVRLDNRDELSHDLRICAEGREVSDSALLLLAWERWRDAALDKLAGAFAFAIWDNSAGSLLLVRDPQGQRPLHYHLGTSFSAFASMPRGIHALAAAGRRPDLQTLARFIDLAPPARGATFFAGVDQVAPGHLVKIRRGNVQISRYWRPRLEPIRLRNSAEYVEAVRERLDVAVRACLRGTNGLVGSHLSAGLDSSGVTATAARMLGSRALIAFTAVPAPRFIEEHKTHDIINEGPFAAETAGLYPNIRHTIIQTEATPLDSLGDGHAWFDQPVPNPCNHRWARAILDEAQSNGLPVMLTGQMGNLSFSHDGDDLLPSLLRSGRFLRLAQETWALRREGTGLRPLASATFGPFVPAVAWRALARRLRKPHLQSDFSLARPNLWSDGDRGRRYGQQPVLDMVAPRIAMLEQLDFGLFNSGILAGWGIDMRDPTGDRRLIELCLRIPADQFLQNGERRAIARRVLSDRLPATVLHERRRGRQSADWHLFLDASKTRIEHEVGLVASTPDLVDLLDLQRLRSLMENWPKQWDGSVQQEFLYRRALLRALSVARFVNSF
jgi:asparagine synthase (glutamine-hydrolysing)